MLLTQENICHYLLEKDLIRKEAVVDGDFVAVAMPTRNNLFKVLFSDSESLFVKQASTFGTVETNMLTREANAYRFISHNREYATLSSNLPRFINYDSKRHVIVMEYFMNTVSTHEYCIQQKVFPAALAREQAHILASYHFPVDEHTDISFFPKEIPWILRVNDFGPYELFPHSRANGELINIIQNHPELRAQLTALKHEWTPTSLIHGDVKWINFIVTQKGNTPKQYLIDWELADIGDPYWDVAGILQSYLTAWIYSFNNHTPANTQLPGNMLAFDLDKMQPAIQHFWNEYSSLAGLSIAENKAMLIKTIRYAAARIMQTAIEGVVYNPSILPNNMRSIQIAHNILKDPAEASKGLLGITI